MKSFLLFLIVIVLISCNNNNGPDVSKVAVSLKTDRFEKAFFSIDSANMLGGLKQLQQELPGFTNDFTSHILGAGLVNDTNQVLLTATKAFQRSYRPVYDSLQMKYADINWLQQQMKSAFQHVEYYFPNYKAPPHLITFVGPFDAPGIAITNDAIAVGLQLFAGKNFSFYNSPQGQELYPAYISARFDQEYIIPAAMKAVAEDLYADKSGGKPLIEQMIEKGKYWYLLDQFIPGTADSLKTGYRQQQLEWCKANEGLIWNFFLQNNQLFSTDPSFNQLYVGEAPDTQGFGEASPGNIGQWVGWQIVKAYAEKHHEINPQKLLETNAQTIFNESKYKPK